MTIPAKTIDEVLGELDQIIENTEAENNYLGIFAYVYRRTTAQIQKAILEKEFEDNERMELMDVAFANLYLKAYKSYTTGQGCSASWETAFKAKKEEITIMQHLLLGMNAHINLDLGVAAVTFAPDTNLPALKNDFMKVNKILNNLTNEMQDRISRVSRLMFILDLLGKNTDEQIANFSMVKARDHAWNLAVHLAERNKDERISLIKDADYIVAALGVRIINPPGKILKLALKLLAFFEEKDIKTIISNLKKD